MKKIFSLFCMMLLAVQFATAQQTLYVISKSGALAAYSASKVAFVTKPADKTINGHKFIDLGLPSGLLWAETNIGAETAADDGNYYAWGETTTKEKYSENNYVYYDTSSSESYTKYNKTDGITVLDKEDDAAYVNWGSSCRMPTPNEFAELLNSKYCTCTWTSMTASDGSSINGCQVTSNTNGNSIFLPASGYRYHEDLYGHGSYGCVWSSTLTSDDSLSAYYFSVDIRLFSMYWDCRLFGFTVRPVAEP